MYLFVSRINEAMLCKNFIKEIASALDIFVPTEISSFASLFRFLMETAQHQPFNLIIDEFQEFYNVNSAIYSEMQDIWDKYRLKTKMNLIVSGSVYSLMNKIFQHEKEPLFNRQDAIIRLKPFNTDTLKEIMNDHAPNYDNDDLLALYTFTGGINTQPAIESAFNGKSIGGHLKRLLNDYNIIKRIRPILSKEGTQTIRYEISDNFLMFWFRYFHRNRSMIEIGNYPAMREVIRADYPTYSGKGTKMK